MKVLSPEFAVDLVLQYGCCERDEHPAARMLTGGVSSHVILVEVPGTDRRWVLKQPCPQLKVRDEWLCSIDRVWREVETLRVCHALLEGVAQSPASGAYRPRVPRIIFEDREHSLYAMTAAQPGAQPWKQALLAGAIDPQIAACCGEMLARLHGGSWRDPKIAARLRDASFFDDLRLDPYYRQIARVHSDLQPIIGELLASINSHPRSLVHGDFSPKNQLVSPREVLLIDFEVGHYGDPAFDLGFFLTHLVCKAIHLPGYCEALLQLANTFWETYFPTLRRYVSSADEIQSLQRRALFNLAACLLARVDGKSPVDYLTPPEQQTVRRLAQHALLDRPTEWADMRGRVEAVARRS